MSIVLYFKRSNVLILSIHLPTTNTFVFILSIMKLALLHCFDFHKPAIVDFVFLLHIYFEHVKAVYF